MYVLCTSGKNQKYSPSTIFADFVDMFNPLPDMPILGSCNSTANKDILSKIWTNWDTVI